MTANSEMLWGAVAAAEDYFFEFEREIEFRELKPLHIYGDLYIFAGEPVPLVWARCVWKKITRAPIASIGEAQKILKKIPGKAFYLSSGKTHRRGVLIQEGLRALKDKPIEFMGKQERSFAFALEAPDSLLYCTEFSRPHPMGVWNFVENKTAPSRAYLKLWEIFSEIGRAPQKNDLCLDLGSSPGGWTWVASELGARVISVDRAPLEGDLMNHDKVEFRMGDAFFLEPRSIGRVDWLLSDVICYPEKLYDYLQGWIESGQARNFVCTLKFQGKCDFKTVKKFADLGSVIHLHHNKHELTWVRLEE